MNDFVWNSTISPLDHSTNTRTERVPQGCWKQKRRQDLSSPWRFLGKRGYGIVNVSSLLLTVAMSDPRDIEAMDTAEV